MPYNESSLRSAITDHKTTNRYIIAHNGDCFLVFGMTADCVLVHRCIFKNGSLVHRPMMKINYDVVKAVIEKPVLCESTGIAVEPPKPAKTRNVTLTPLETEILHHRLEVPDAISEAIDAPIDVVDTACDFLIAKRGDVLNWLDVTGKFLESVLIDAVEGSTWLAAMSDESSQKFASHEKAYLSLLDKVQRATGKPVGCATY